MLGFDILLDKKCKPYIIEINHNPSFKLPTPLDVEIKTAALAGCLGIVCNKYMPYPVPGDTAKSQPLASEHCAASPESVCDGASGAASARDRRHVPDVAADVAADKALARAASADAAQALVDAKAAVKDDKAAKAAVVDDKAAAQSASTAASADAMQALESQRAALFKVTGLGARQQQLQEAFAPSSFARVKAGVHAAARELPVVCEDEAGTRLISSREWSLQTLYDCVGQAAPAMQVMGLRVSQQPLMSYSYIIFIHPSI